MTLFQCKVSLSVWFKNPFDILENILWHQCTFWILFIIRHVLCQCLSRYLLPDGLTLDHFILFYYSVACRIHLMQKGKKSSHRNRLDKTKETEMLISYKQEKEIRTPRLWKGHKYIDK